MLKKRKKMWYIYTMEYYSAMRKEDILPFMTTWIYLEHIMLREISQKERQVLYGTTCLWKLKKLHLLKTESKMVVTRAWREEVLSREMVFKGINLQ